MKIWFTLLMLTLFSNASFGENLYSIDISTWPKDVVEKIEKEEPNLKKSNLTSLELDQLLKNLDRNFNFNSLKLVSVNGDKKLKLVGDISARYTTPEFVGLKDLEPTEAISLMDLANKNYYSEDDLKQASERLTQYYKNLGYRFADVTYSIQDNETLEKNVVFKINLKNQTEVSFVKLLGLQDADREEIERSLAKKFSGSIVNQDNLNAINKQVRQSLSEKGFYLATISNPQLSFNAEESRAVISFKIDKTQKYRVEINNVHEFPRLRLEDEVLDLDNYFSTDENISTDLTARLKNFYKSQGYAFIEVSYAVTRENNAEVLIFNLDEGPYTKINQIKFVGQFSKDESFYRKKLLQLSSEKVQDHVYIKDDLDLAAKNLVTYLQNDGYVSAKLGRIQTSFENEATKKQINLTLQLIEGPQTQIRQIILRGNNSISREEILKALDLQVGHALSLSELEKGLQNLKAYYASQGFIEVKIENEHSDLLTYSDKNESAHIKIIISEGAHVKAQTIIIEGNQKTHDKVVLAELEFKPGDYLTPYKMEESISRLQRTGLFSTVEIGTLEAGSLISDRTVIVKVTERNPGLFNVGGGWTSENFGTVYGFTGIAYRNLGGWGRGISARLDGNYNYADIRFLESKITLGFVEPYLFESRARMRITHIRSRVVSDITIRKVTEKNSGVLSFEQDFTSHFTGIWEVFNVATYVDRGITAEDETNYGYQRQDMVISTTGPTLDFDYRDNIFNPTSGSFHRLTAELSLPSLSSNIDQFMRFTGMTNWYFPISSSDIVFAQSLQGGYVKDIGDLTYGVPFDKKGFVLGGRSTIRGFEASEFFPSNEVTGINFKLFTESYYELVKSELRFPLNRKWGLMGAVFYDGGQVLINGLTLTDPWRDAVGVGLRYNTPVGPLNIEYGFKLDKKAGESDGAFHLSLGVF